MFWVEGQPGPRRLGVLTAEPGRSPSLVVQGALTAMMRHKSKSERPQDLHNGPLGSEPTYEFEPAKDLSLRTVHGVADDGTAVTLLEAQNRRYEGFLPDDQIETLVGTHAVIGAHLTGREHTFTAVRARVQAAQSLLTVSQHEAEIRLADGAALSVERDRQATWLVLDGTPPASVRLMDRTYLRPVASLLSLAAGRDAGLLALQTRSAGHDGAWCSIYSGAHRYDDLPAGGAFLLGSGDLTAASVCAWLDVASTLGPLPPVVVNALTGAVPLETRILELTTLCEGLHRRLYPDARRFPDETATEIRKAAATAAEAVHPDAGKIVDGYLSHVDEIGYAQRLRALADLAEVLVPGITGRTGKWRSAVYDARNDFAHRAREGWLSDDDVDRYVTVALSLRWVLHVVLLGQARLPPKLLEKRFAAHVPYRLFLKQAAEWQPRIYSTPRPTGPC